MGLRLPGTIQLALHAVVQGRAWLWLDDPEALARKRTASGSLALRARIVLTCAEILLAIERISGLGLSPDRVTWTADTDPYAGHDMGARWSAEARKAVVLKICSPLAPESHTSHLARSVRAERP